MAIDWVERYGGTIHQRRADVLAHFKKDPANLSIRWEQYSSEYLHRYQNIQTLLNNGVDIDEQYQQRLIANHRALSQPLPDELNPVSSPELEKDKEMTKLERLNEWISDPTLRKEIEHKLTDYHVERDEEGIPYRVSELSF